MPLSAQHFRFNPCKHHLAYISNELKRVRLASSTERDNFFEIIRAVNANFVDVYTGTLTPGEIQEKIAVKLNALHIFSEDSFEAWLGTERYKIITLDDNSRWVLRKSDGKDAFVHIHPSRTPPLTFRVHGNAWRTAVGMLIMFPELHHQLPELQKVNRFRKEFLELSPVKGEENLKRVLKVFELLNIHLLKA